MALKIIKESCVGCGACISVCPFGALVIEDDKATVLANCTMCGACVEVCGFEAIVLERDETVAIDTDAYRGIWVFVQHDAQGIHHVSLELVGEGRRLADELGTTLSCLVLGEDVDRIVEELAAYPIDRVYVGKSPVLAGYRTRAYVTAAAGLIREHKPEIVLIGATTTGRDFAGGLATELGTGLTADCTDLGVDPETRSLLQTRPAFGGNIMATIKSARHRPQMATVRPKVFPLPEKGDQGGMDIIVAGPLLDEADEPTRILEWIASKDGVNIADADIIVAGGRGIGGPENFALLHELADLLGGAVGASRATVDAGWIDYAHQVGQTGRTVRPKVYIACGISGAVQHLAGMKTSDTIIAVNRDPDAAIFHVATYGYVGDCMEFVKNMISELKRRNGRS